MLGAEAGHDPSLRTGRRLPKAIGLWTMAARRGGPQAHGTHQLNFEKSGLRFWKKALKASVASGLDKRAPKTSFSAAMACSK